MAGSQGLVPGKDVPGYKGPPRRISRIRWLDNQKKATNMAANKHKRRHSDRKELQTGRSGEMPSPEQVWEWTGRYRSAGPAADPDAGWERLRARLGTEEPSPAAEPVVRMPAWRRPAAWVAAASVLLLAGAFALHFGLQRQAGQMVVATGAGERQALRLEDGTEVTLNETSEISYPSDFSESERVLALAGEAYFAVTHRQGQSFTVRTDAGEVKVLGTTFNVRAYPGEERMEVYVESGKVAVTLSGRTEPVVLRPGERLEYHRADGRATVRRETVPNVLAWKSGRLQFRNTPLSEILAMVTRQFGPTFRLEAGRDLSDCPFTVQVSREAVEEGLQAISMVCPISFEVQPDGAYLVTGNCCR